ncbi:DUF4886 domain-containing protein [Planctomicrobium sp. SH527]|uniref:DUF4886 domain-containing protein n=1 Tax=Planctomicrobium sp. SH527 TaxID=3448123 RepID=UPI003F5C4D84
MNLTRTLRSIFCLVLLWQLAATAALINSHADAAEQQKSDSKTVRLLTIGNSFSRNATKYLDKLATADGHTLIHRPIIVGGASMELHATKALQHQANPEAPEGEYADRSSLQQRLQEDQWDVVTIQQASRLSWDENTYRPYAFQLRDFVKANAPQARLMVHQTWAYRVDDPWFVSPAKGSSNPVTEEEMHQKLRAAYFKIAAELDAGVIPVGNAFHLATQDKKWSYRQDKNFNFADAKFPNLPDQPNSIHTGWRWTTQKDVKALAIDGHHANAAGEYLGSCVFYEVLFGEDVRKNTFVPETLDPQFAAFLRETAHLSVAELKTSQK